MKNKQLLAQGKIESKQAGYELGRYAREVLGISNRQLQKIVRTKGLLVNGRLRHSKYKLQANDLIEAYLPSSEQIKIPPAPASELVVLYEDAWLLGAEKPASIPSYDIKSPRGLANQVVGYFAEQGLKLTPRPVHRLDTPTSGVVVFAKDAHTQTELSTAWQSHQVERFYWALCHGVITEPLELMMPINNQVAHTKVVPLEVHENYTELKIELITGRTHQIRQHLAAIDHPLVGDRRYGTGTGQKKHTRLALHATQVRFSHPHRKGELVAINSPIPRRDFSFLKVQP